MLTDSLQAAVASLLGLLQLYGTLRENWKIKGKTEIYALPFPSLTPKVFFQELDISNVNFISQISFIYKTLNI